MRVPSRKRNSAQSRRYPKVGWRRIKSAIRAASGSLIAPRRGAWRARRRTPLRATARIRPTRRSDTCGLAGSLVGRLPPERAVFARLLPDIHVEDQFPDLLLALLDLLVLQGVILLRASPVR